MPGRRRCYRRAPADPTADVEGFDVQAKIALLTKLAFGATVSSDSVRREELERERERRKEGRGNLDEAQSSQVR